MKKILLFILAITWSGIAYSQNTDSLYKVRYLDSVVSDINLKTSKSMYKKIEGNKIVALDTFHYVGFYEAHNRLLAKLIISNRSNVEGSKIELIDTIYFNDYKPLKFIRKVWENRVLEVDFDILFDNVNPIQYNIRDKQQFVALPEKYFSDSELLYKEITSLISN